LFKKIFHRIAYRIYIVSKNAHDEKRNKNYPTGLSKISNLEKIEIGKNVSFGGEVMILGGGKVIIGNNTMIGACTIIHTSTHDYNLHPMNEKRIDMNVVVGENVWIGTGVIILPGVTIGSYSVIGAGSVVTKNVEIGTIVSGVPAKLIKMRPKGIF